MIFESSFCRVMLKRNFAFRSYSADLVLSNDRVATQALGNQLGQLTCVVVCYRRPPSSPHIHSARTAQDGSRKRYSYTSIKNHATVSQAALSNFDRQYDTNTLTRSCLMISRYDDPKKNHCSRLTSEIQSFAFDTLRQTRLSDKFLIRRVRLKFFFLLKF